jgi:FAD binding domain
VTDELPESFRNALAAIVGQQHVLTDDDAAGFSVDWTGRFQGRALAVVRPRDTAEVAAVLALCTDAGKHVVPQGGNTGLVGGGVPLHGEVVLSPTRLKELGIDCWTMNDDDNTQVSDVERALIGSLVEGTVAAVFRWGVVVELGFSHVGFIDALYVDDGDRYEVGDKVSAYLTRFDARQNKFWLRPPGQTPVSERLRKKGFDI